MCSTVDLAKSLARNEASLWRGSRTCAYTQNRAHRQLRWSCLLIQACRAQIYPKGNKQIAWNALRTRASSRSCEGLRTQRVDLAYPFSRRKKCSSYREVVRTRFPRVNYIYCLFGGFQFRAAYPCTTNARSKLSKGNALFSCPKCMLDLPRLANFGWA